MGADGETKKPDNSYHARLERLRDELTGPSVSELIQMQKVQQDRLFNKTKGATNVELADRLDPVSMAKEISTQTQSQENSTIPNEDDIIPPDDEKYENNIIFV